MIYTIDQLRRRPGQHRRAWEIIYTTTSKEEAEVEIGRLRKLYRDTDFQFRISRWRRLP